MSAEKFSLWRYVESADANATDLDPDSLAEPRNQKWSAGVITVRGWEWIKVMAFADGADTNTFDMRVFGWMDNGPGYNMAEYLVTLGGDSPSVPILPRNARNASPILPASYNIAKAFGVAYSFIDFGGVVTAGNDYFGGKSEIPNAGPSESSILLLPTLGFKHLQCELYDFGGSITAAGLIWCGHQATRLGAAR